MTIYTLLDYKAALKASIEEQKTSATKGRQTKLTFQGMAAACGIQKTYLSRILNGKSHLTEDQLFLASKYVGLDTNAINYLMLLLSYQRTEVKSRKRELFREIEKMQADMWRFKLSQKGHEFLDDPQYTRLFADADSELVLALLQLERFAQNPPAICEVLGLTNERVNEIIKMLNDLGFIKIKDEKILYMKRKFLLDSTSPFYSPYMVAQRVRSLEKVRSVKKDENLVMSIIFNADETYRARFQARVLALLEEIEAEHPAARREEVYQINLDLFSWTLAN